MTAAAAAAFADVFHLMVVIAVLTAVPQGEAASAVVSPGGGP